MFVYKPLTDLPGNQGPGQRAVCSWQGPVADTLPSVLQDVLCCSSQIHCLCDEVACLVCVHMGNGRVERISIAHKLYKQGCASVAPALRALSLKN